METDLERAEERAEQSECKIVELEEELRVVGNNLKSLEVSEEKANQREEEYKNQIKTLTTRLKEATQREETYEGQVKLLDAQLKEAMASRDHVEDKIHSLTQKLTQWRVLFSGLICRSVQHIEALVKAEARAEFAERSVQKLQKEVDRLEDDLVAEREKSKILQEEMEATLHDIQNM
ncbi:hypothetical protein KGM_205416 [Danaus plexippus plexippus]|uniref:Tropomyosin n=1 Tax=Danaus plexippus plexippus TaxID=278856 RepID=A0A212F7M3_DANPL|nr:hypothetical protein KGM_205416 [Danaus plexippus plexippus]